MTYKNCRIDYIPHGCVLGKYKGDLRVFCSWTGGYLDGDSWRLNSKVRTVDFEDKSYIINKEGSSYQLSVLNYGRISAYNNTVLISLEDKGFEVLNGAEANNELEVLLDRAKELVGDIEVNLDEPLDPEDEY